MARTPCLRCHHRWMPAEHLFFEPPPRPCPLVPRACRFAAAGTCCSKTRCRPAGVVQRPQLTTMLATPGTLLLGLIPGAPAGVWRFPCKGVGRKACDDLHDGGAEEAVPVQPQHHNMQSEARLLRPCSVHGSRLEATTFPLLSA